ncbi:hypothetical protein A3SI_05619 [Nitritalea halalkaliphila LW7]|uniref:DinB-like domain-containing protein n=1 Tax=Nitritalea halalkaliphila LW7 TaxID=1189621 RepID=I5C7N0_9BACT|nr:DinB family protein [Nitritalea halalkaliphila]EIM77832.1 hypothetical protein A3SI_05619 [Nitritalea halalkaliphila LW7]
MDTLLRPEAGEYPAYYTPYVARVLHKDLFKLLLAQVDELRMYYEEAGEEKALKAYAPGKWSPKELLGHLIDTERVMLYRAMAIARGDQTELPGFDENAYVAAADFNEVPLVSLLEEFEMLRYHVLSFFKNLRIGHFERKGHANGGQVSVRAIFHMIPGHIAHHMEILKERY